MLIIYSKKGTRIIEKQKCTKIKEIIFANEYLMENINKFLHDENNYHILVRTIYLHVNNYLNLHGKKNIHVKSYHIVQLTCKNKNTCNIENNAIDDNNQHVLTAILALQFCRFKIGEQGSYKYVRSKYDILLLSNHYNISVISDMYLEINIIVLTLIHVNISQN